MTMTAVAWSARTCWSLCALAAWLATPTDARTVAGGIAREPQPHALPGIINPVTDHQNHNNACLISSAAPARHARSYPHLQGDTRLRKLYSFQKFFLRIDRTGTVSGTRSRDDAHTILEITSVNVGVVAVRSLITSYYLAMNRRGEVYGEREYSMNCQLRERIEENGYNTYASAHWRRQQKPMYISLNTKGKPRRGQKTHRRNMNTHFLPIIV